MKTAVINIKTDPQTKKQAQKIAGAMGFGLSAILNGFLRQMIKDQSVSFSSEPTEVPSKWLEKSLAQAEKDEKDGYVSPTFDNFEDSLAWLNDPKAKYINGKSTKNDR